MKHPRLMVAVLAALLLIGLAGVCACAAEIRPLETDPSKIDLNNGTFCLTIPDPEHVDAGGYFAAQLFLEDRYDAAQVKALRPGDTAFMNGRAWTVREIVVHESERPGDEAVYEVYPEEDYGGYLVFQPSGDGTFLAVIDDWVPVSPAGEVKVMLPLPDRFAYVTISAGEESEPAGMDAFLNALRNFGDFNAYNTVCTFEEGQLVYVLHSSYPQGPEENWPGPEEEAASSSEAIPVWKFFHGDPDLLETAVIMGSTLDCEAGPIPTEVPEEEQEELRTLAMYGVVTGRQSDEMVTGGTWLYSFETPEGKHIMTVELYRGLLVGPDGMYAYTVPQSAVSE